MSFPRKTHGGGVLRIPRAKPPPPNNYPPSLPHRLPDASQPRELRETVLSERLRERKARYLLDIRARCENEEGGHVFFN